MVEPTPDDFSRSSVGPLARFLLISAREDSSLLRRTAPAKFASESARLTPLPRREPFWRESAPARESYLEDLVSIAITSARQADDASRQARASMAKSRRGVYAFAALGILGVTVAAADLAGRSILIAAGIVSAKAEGGPPTAGSAAKPIQFVRLLPTESPFGQPPTANAGSVDAPSVAGDDRMASSEPNDGPVVRTTAVGYSPPRETTAPAPISSDQEVAALPPLQDPRAQQAREDNTTQVSRFAARPRPHVVHYVRYRPEPPLWRFVANLQRNVSAIFR
jgi:hypothetical protein